MADQKSTATASTDVLRTIPLSRIVVRDGFNPRGQVDDDAELQRAERRRADRQFAQQAVEALRQTAGWQRWLTVRRHFHRYSFHNQLLIALQCPDATRVAGFRSWLKLGYVVRKGERALRIWVPIPPSKAALERWQRAGAVAADKPRTHFRLGPVFDRSQVEELPPPAEPVPLDPPIADVEGDSLASNCEPLVALAAELGSTVELEAMPELRGGYYEPATKRIALNSSLSVNGRVKTLVHELAHALVRAEPAADGSKPLSYAEEELIVESVAYTVCGSLGLDVAGYAIPYLASWAEAANLETLELRAALIDRLARRIEDAALAEQIAPSALAPTVVAP